MIELILTAGLPLWLVGDELKFGDDVIVQETRSRRRGELAPVAFEPASCVPPDVTQYWMYNGIRMHAHQPRLASSPLQYELTLMLPQPLGPERAKTLGHIHNAPGLGLASFPEIFEVLYGTAHFVFYTLGPEPLTSHYCGWIQAQPGDKIMSPSNLFHLVINGADTPLLFANLISKRAHGIYDPVRATRGAPYFQMNHGEWRRNPVFRDTAPLNYVGIRMRQESAPLYTQFVNHPDAMAWLDEPVMFPQQFE